MNDIVEAVATPIAKAKPFAMAQLKLAKHSPEIMVGVGIIGMVTGTVLACRATLKAPEIMADAKQKFADIQEATEMETERLEHGIESIYTKKDRQQDLVKASIQTGVDFVKLYGFPVAIMSASIFCITKGHSITMKRNAALSSAFSMLSAGYAEYRKRVREAYGEEAERKLYYNLREDVVEYKDANGKAKKATALTAEDSEYPTGIYTRVFEPSNPQYAGSVEVNRAWLQCQQNYWNDMLRINGFVFLNDVYKCLGFGCVPEGQLVGWMYDSERGDGYINFNIQDLDFYEVNGDPYYKPVRWILDFNVDGEIYRLIGQKPRRY